MIRPPRDLRLPIAIMLASPLPFVFQPNTTGSVSALSGSSFLLVAGVMVVWFLRRPTCLFHGLTREALVTRLARLALPWIVVPAVATLVMLPSIHLDWLMPAWLWVASVGLFTLGTLLYAQAMARARAGWYAEHCPKCGYDISSCEVPICPECGRPITPAPDFPT